MDPVQKAVINHTFGVPLVKTKRPIISCNVCQIRFNSEVSLWAFHHGGCCHVRCCTPSVGYGCVCVCVCECVSVCGWGVCVGSGGVCGARVWMCVWVSVV